MRNMISVVLMLIVWCVSLPCLAWSGAWTLQRGHLYTNVRASYFSSGKTFDSNGIRTHFLGNGLFEDRNITWYQEYGLLYRVGLILSTSYKWLAYRNENGDIAAKGAGDIDLGTKVRLLDTPAVTTLQLLIKIPGGYRKDDEIPLGNGQLDVESRLLIGMSLAPLPAYYGVEIGYRWRMEKPVDQFRYLLELGGGSLWRFSVRTKLDGAKSVSRADQTADPSANPTARADYDVGKLEGTLGVRMTDPFSLELTYTRCLYGRNIAYGDHYTMAVVYIY